MSPRAIPPRAPLPPVIRRFRWWFLVPPGVAVVAHIAVFLPGLLEGSGRFPIWWQWGLPVLTFVPLIITTAWMFVTLRRITRAVRASGFHACTHCVHDLRGLGQTGLCPECGKAFDIEADRKSWARAKIV